MEATAKPEDKPKVKVKFKVEDANDGQIEAKKASNPKKFENFDFKFDRTSPINDLYSLMSYLAEIINQYTSSITELDYRVYNKHPKKELKKLSLAEKYQLIGKIGSKPTKLDISSYSSNSILYSHKNKIWLKKKEAFPSCRTNNCLVNGKWSYEVVMLTNGLLQLGFSQLLTPNTVINGIGDDDTSFGFDGYRKVIYHKKALSYGRIWDVGDVIGVCIDMTNKRLEYFLNGKSLGIVHEGNIQCGKNIAYFPALSATQEERVFFNFGELPFNYNYQGYEPIDIMKSRYDNSLNVSAKLMNVLDTSLLDLLSKGNNAISQAENIAITKLIFSFLINVSFKDLFICRDLLFPFLGELLKRSEEKFTQFFKQIENYYRFTDKTKRKKFYSRLMETLCNLAEEYALIGSTKIKQWETIMELIINLVCTHHIFKKWIKSPKISFHLCLLWSSNTVHMYPIYETILVQCKTNKFSRSKQLKNLIANSSKFYPDSAVRNEERISKALSKFIFAFIYMCKKINRLPLCFSIIMKTIKGYYRLDLLVKCEFEKLIVNDARNNVNLIKNFIYNYMQMFFDYFSIMPFKKIDEDRFASNIFKSIHLMVPFVNSFLLSYNAYYKYAKALPDVGWEINGEISTLRLESIYRNFFHFFNENSQKILFQFSFYLTQYLLYRFSIFKLVYDQKEIQFPALITKCLYKYHSKALRDPNLSKQLLANCAHFSKTSYFESVLRLYIELFAKSGEIQHQDQTKFIMKHIGFLIKKPLFTKVLFENKELTQKLIKSIVYYTPYVGYHKPLCNIIGKLMIITNRKYLTQLSQTLTIIAKPSKEAFTTYCVKYVEEKMNEYLLNLNSAKTKGYEQYDYIHLMWHKRGYSGFCRALNVYAFVIVLILADPLQKIDPKNSIIWIKFKLLLVNLTSRLFSKSAIEDFKKLQARYLLYHAKPYGLSLLKILTAISGLFNPLHARKEALNEIEEMMACNDSIVIESLKNLIVLEFHKKEGNDQVSSDDLYAFTELIHRVDEKRAVEMENRQKRAKDIEDDEKLCILCFANESNRMVLPCRHTACFECLSLYLKEKNSCFICRQPIEKVIEIKEDVKEEVVKEVKDKVIEEQVEVKDEEIEEKDLIDYANDYLTNFFQQIFIKKEH